MPLPFILLGIAALAGGTGVVSGGMGAKKIHEAKDIINAAEYDYKMKKKLLDKEQESTTTALDELGKLKLDVWQSFKRFSDAFEKIKNKPQFTKNKNDKYTFSKHELDEIQSISITALNILGSTVLSAGAGALAGFAAFGGTAAIGVASTGTAISSLSGVAAYNATMAALGGGSIAAGGGGIALGSTVLAGAVAGPVVAVGGLLLNAKGNSSIKKAEEVRDEVDHTISLMNDSLKYLNKLKDISNELKSELKKSFALYEKQVSVLEYLVSREDDYNRYTTGEKQVVDNNIMLVKLLKDMTQVDLIKKENDKDVVQTSAVHKEIDKSKEIREKLVA